MLEYRLNKIEPPQRATRSKKGERKGSDVAEHVIVGAHRVVVHKQFASEGFVVEVACEVVHLAFKVRLC